MARVAKNLWRSSNMDSFPQPAKHRLSMLISIWKSLVLMEVGDPETEFGFQNPDNIWKA